MVSPGWVDVHTHFFPSGFPRGAVADEACLPHGVTSAIDAGTTGWATFRAFRSEMSTYRTRVRAFLHVSALGLLPLSVDIPELNSLSSIRTDEAVACIQENRDLILGIKVRLTIDAFSPEHADHVLRSTLAIAKRADCPIMIHISGSPLPLPLTCASGLLYGYVTSYCN